MATYITDTGEGSDGLRSVAIDAILASCNIYTLCLYNYNRWSFIFQLK